MTKKKKEGKPTCIIQQLLNVASSYSQLINTGGGGTSVENLFKRN